MKTIEQTTTTEVPGYEVIAQADLLRAIDAELARIGEKPVDFWGSIIRSVSINFESPIWAAQCSVNVGFKRVDVTCEDYSACRLYAVEVDIIWSSTGRSVAQAAVALDNYRRALGIATFIEALTQGKYIAVVK